jgi:hypothetical protein
MQELELYAIRNVFRARSRCASFQEYDWRALMHVTQKFMRMRTGN